MNIKLLLTLLTVGLLSCKDLSKNKVTTNSTKSSEDTVIANYSDKITALEQASIGKDPNDLGELINRISFNVTTDNKKDYEDGIIPWVSIENPKDDLANLVDLKKVVINQNRVTIIIDYPLTNEYRFDVISKSGFTRELLLSEISKHYYKLYEEEEKSATIKTLPQDKRTIANRNQTNGKYGIWGHDISDLDLSEILVYKTITGQIILSLNIES